MYTRARIGDHAIHPMLVAFPVAFYTATVVALIAYAAGAEPFWFHVGFVANVAGVLTAIIAAVPGVIDWAVGIPKDSPAKRTGLAHMLANVVALVLFAINALVLRDQWAVDVPRMGNATLVLPIGGIALTLIAGRLGWSMVQVHHVGVELTPDQERLEPQPRKHIPVEPAPLGRH